jgi:hypothetical protein
MKRFFIVFPLLFALGACASLQTAWDVATGTEVSPTQIIVAANAFDAGEASATQYLMFCKSVAPAPSYCALSTRKTVVAAVRAGRAARIQLEPYIVSGAAGPAALYNTLVATITTLQSQIPTSPTNTLNNGGMPIPAPSAVPLLPLPPLLH